MCLVLCQAFKDVYLILTKALQGIGIIITVMYM